MYKGYELALKRKGPVSFKFQGVETTLYPDQLPLDDNMIDIRIKDILKETKTISNVSFILICILLPFCCYFSFLQNFKVPSGSPARSSSVTVTRKPRNPGPSSSSVGKEATSNLLSSEKKTVETSKEAATKSPQSTLEEDMKEYKEKERLILALAECDKRIDTFESCLLNLHSGKVK